MTKNELMNIISMREERINEIQKECNSLEQENKFLKEKLNKLESSLELKFGKQLKKYVQEMIENTMKIEIDQQFIDEYTEPENVACAYFVNDND